ncbi:MAG: terpenoid cyclase/protein prenyltransferase alpha-alpha toroid, partial [Verrucomicrobiaceae bacterium]|nr:terpenoid cyclase/protein prenyltransferase alpha-alpha toroid [Verrucomicrobiaceae bacterium]
MKKVSLVLCLPLFLALLTPLPAAAKGKSKKSSGSSPSAKKPSLSNNSTGRARIAERNVELDINPPEFGPGSTIELIFANPMIPPERVGSVEPDSPITVEPALPGKFEWTSTRTGLYRLTQAPRFASSYHFKLRAGMRDVTGVEVAPCSLRDVNTELFRIVGQYPTWFGDDISRTPEFLFEFNDPVNAEAVVPGMAFKCAQTKEKIDVKARMATGADFKHFQATPNPTWAEELADTKINLEPAAVRESAVIVGPVSPLNPGKEWVLSVTNAIVNRAATSRLGTGDEIKIGSIKPFIVDEIKPHSPFDAARYVNLIFNRPLADVKDAPGEQIKENQARVADLASFVMIDPPAPDTRLTIDGRTLRVSGGFELGKPYHVTVAAEVISADGLKLAAAAEAHIAFAPNPPYVAVPTHINAQLATGSGHFEFTAANITQVRVRAKRLTGAQLVNATAAYQDYAVHNGTTDEERRKFKPKAFDSFPGSVVFDHTYPFNKPLDQSTMTTLNWHEVLGSTPAAPLFIELEGPAMPGVEGRATIAQTIVEFTDIGLFLKNDFKTSTVLAVSLKTGKPLPNVRISLAAKNGALTGSAETDLNGLASLEGKEPAYVLAEKEGDATAMECGQSSTFVPLWSANLSTAWVSPWDAHRKTFVFSDRPLYKPGETAHIKAYTRSVTGDAMTLATTSVTAVAELRDPRFRVVLEKPVTFAANGSWADDILLPSGPTGWYHLALKFPKKNGAEDDSQTEEAAVGLRVDDYKPNTFEAKLDAAALTLQPDRIKLPLSASYFMGQPLTRAKVTWNAYRTDEFTPPEALREYHFGDAPRWAHYGEDRDPDTADSEEVQLPQWDAAGELALNAEGKAVVELPMPPALRGAMPQKVSVQAEITDINEQTLSSSTEFTVPGGDFVIGLRGPAFFAATGKAVSLEALAITPDGKPYTQDIKAAVKVERQSYHPIKVKTAGGGETTRNQVVLEEQLNQNTTLHAQASTNAASITLPFTPKLGGTYFLTVEAQDAAGKKLLSRIPFYVVGGGEFPWAVEDGATITLQPDKTVFKPGETASIVVKTPIAGTALVSVERNHLHSHFQTIISPDNPVIRVPLMAADAPNVFVSVLIFRGAQDSPQAVKMPAFKLGYCELTVQSNAHDLGITLKPEHDIVLPGQPVNFTATIADSAGKTLPNADVTLFAVDEGVLSLMSFKTPDPSAYFNAAQPLAVRNNTNFGEVLTEDEKIRQRGNKGFVVGGGGDDAETNIPTRKNFIATALWAASTTTDASGQVKASFTAPDNLSRFRLMAVAAESADRFGHADVGITIQKPLMVEPAMPRFARLDDELLLKAVLHNTTSESGEVEVSLTLDDKADFIAEVRPFSPPGNSAPEGKTWKRTLILRANETAAVAFPVKLTHLGPAKWAWQAKTSQWSGTTALSDKMESNFNVEHPMQELREAHYFQLTGKDASPNLLQGVSPMILEGQGTVAVTVSNSELSEVRDALGYVLQYPYGCVEQTASAMMPWMALGGFNELFPQELDASKSRKALQMGVNKLLSMVTDNGGLSYWPGGNEPSMWGTAYGGLALLKARGMGLPVPPVV